MRRLVKGFHEQAARVNHALHAFLRDEISTEEWANAFVRFHGKYCQDVRFDELERSLGEDGFGATFSTLDFYDDPEMPSSYEDIREESEMLAQRWPEQKADCS